MHPTPLSRFFFFNDTATTEIYTLSLHDALPIYEGHEDKRAHQHDEQRHMAGRRVDRKSTRLNSSHQIISYAVFCLKKKKKNTRSPDTEPSPHTSRPPRSTHDKQPTPATTDTPPP